MMNQQPDNFFQEKLQDYRKPVPPGAWDKIGLRLKKNETPFRWYKVAASLLLLSTIGYLLIPKKKDLDPQSLAQTTIESESSVPAENQKNVIEPPQDKKNKAPKSDNSDSVDKITLGGEKVSGKFSTEKVKTFKKKIFKHPAENKTEPLETLKETNQSITNHPSPIPTVAKAEPDAEHVSKPQTITLKFSLEETNEYLSKNAVAQATSDEKKSSTLKKLLKKANDLKSNQDPFGDLREKKNEILALNFKNEKRGQNK